MNYENITRENRNKVTDFIIKQWYSTKMIIRGKEFDMTLSDGIFMSENEEIVALITYIFYDDICEVTSLNSLRENIGIGTSLLNKVIENARLRGCRKIVIVTTNDNINAIKFYQKRGFDMTNLYYNSLELSRKLKPEMPLIGENDIPLKHELQFEMIL